MYIKKTYKAGNTIEVHKSFSPRRGKTFTRGEPVNKTPEAMAKYNDKLSKWKLSRLINNNFGTGDIHVVLSYPKGKRPSEEESVKELDNAIKNLRRWLEKKGKPKLKYVRATAIGSRGAIHHHLILNVNDMELLERAWTGKVINVTPLYSNGNYAPLAVYFCGQEKGVSGGEIVIHGNGWSTSRNLNKPKEPKVEDITAIRWKEPPKPIKGYIIDVDSIYAGLNPVNGQPYLFYRMVKIQKSRKGLYNGLNLDELLAENKQAVIKKWENDLKDKGLKPIVKKKRKKQKVPAGKDDTANGTANNRGTIKGKTGH